MSGPARGASGESRLIRSRRSCDDAREDHIRKSGQGLGSGMVESFFKRRPADWLFAAPLMWPRRTYLVTDEQKARLIEALRCMWWTQILTGIVAAIGLLIFLQDRPALTQAIVLGSVVVGIFILWSVYA